MGEKNWLPNRPKERVRDRQTERERERVREEIKEWETKRGGQNER